MRARWTAPGIPTPSLVVDLEVCERNIAAMARRCTTGGLALRPHAKTHKTAEVAARQLAAGATGLTVATLGEAEVLATHGVDDLFVAYPLWAAGDLGRRLASLAGTVRLAVGADSVEGVRLLSGALGRGTEVRVLVEVDCGLRRTGVPPADAATVAVCATDCGLAVGGVFTFPGHGYGPGAAAGARDDEERALAAGAASLEAAGIECPTRSGGSTPTAPFTRGGVVTELRPGVYVFNDAQQVALGTCSLDDVALAALATVVSAPASDRVVLDAGTKVLGAERPSWTPGHGLLPAYPGAIVTGLWEHHGVVDVSAVGRGERPRLGEQVAIVPNHVCTAVNLARALHVVADGAAVETWSVAAAGANR
ncbi:MAG: alanine racemase [Acidimicrobiales bacterium]